MRLAVFGATGKTGRMLVKQALEEGDSVVVYARNPAKLGMRSDRLTLIEGELNERWRIEGAVKGADAVLSLLGPKGGSEGKPLTAGVENIISAMQDQGVRRLVAISNLSAKDPNDLPELRARFLVGLTRLTEGSAYEDVVGVVNAIRESGLDWTVLRLPRLNDGPKSGRVRAGYLGRGEVGSSVSRADVADFMLKQTKDWRYVGQAPAVSG